MRRMLFSALSLLRMETSTFVSWLLLSLVHWKLALKASTPPSTLPVWVVAAGRVRELHLRRKQGQRSREPQSMREMRGHGHVQNCLLQLKLWNFGGWVYDEWGENRTLQKYVATVHLSLRGTSMWVPRPSPWQTKCGTYSVGNMFLGVCAPLHGKKGEFCLPVLSVRNASAAVNLEFVYSADGGKVSR